jgi:predicted ATP-grasp superfamily ATP-dependent carboligase
MPAPRVLLATTVVPDDRKTLACARALAKEGIWVAVGGDGFFGQAYWSRAVRKRVRYPHPAVDAGGFYAELRRHAEENAIDVVLPMNDYTTQALARGKNLLPARCRTALPAPEALEVAACKHQTLALASRLGIETPATHLVSSLEELEEVAGRVRYPCVCKLSRGSGAVGLSFPANRQELLQAWRARRPSADAAFDYGTLLVQEWVPGETRDVCVIARHGEPILSLTQRRRWMHPRRGGVGVSVETTQDEALQEPAHRLLRALAWHGPACVEFRWDPPTGRAWLIEINGRLGGSSAAGIHAGVNYPLLLTQLAMEGEIAPTPYQVGRRFRWPMPFAFLALRDGGTLREVIREFVLPAPGSAVDLQLRDPMPHLAEILFAVRRVFPVGGEGWRHAGEIR